MIGTTIARLSSILGTYVWAALLITLANAALADAGQPAIYLVDGHVRVKQHAFHLGHHSLIGSPPDPTESFDDTFDLELLASQGVLDSTNNVLIARSTFTYNGHYEHHEVGKSGSKWAGVDVWGKPIELSYLICDLSSRANASGTVRLVGGSIGSLILSAAIPDYSQPPAVDVHCKSGDGMGDFYSAILPHLPKFLSQGEAPTLELGPACLSARKSSGACTLYKFAGHVNRPKTQCLPGLLVLEARGPVAGDCYEDWDVEIQVHTVCDPETGNPCQDCKDGKWVDRTDPPSSVGPLAVALIGPVPGPQCPSRLTPTSWLSQHWRWLFGQTKAVTYGCTDAITVDVSLRPRCEAGKWAADLLTYQGRYAEFYRQTDRQPISIDAKNNISTSANIGAGNYCTAVRDLGWLGGTDPDYASQNIFYSLDAVRAHEDVHRKKLLPALKQTLAQLESDLSSLSVSARHGQLEADALHELTALPGFKKAKIKACQRWQRNYQDAVNDDHLNGGATCQAEKDVVFPIMKALCELGRKSGWAHCEYCDTNVESTAWYNNPDNCQGDPQPPEPVKQSELDELCASQD